MINGGDGDDLVYGGNKFAAKVNQRLYGDIGEYYAYYGKLNDGNGGSPKWAYYDDSADPPNGGNDQIWGGDDLMFGQFIAGGWYDDKIWTGNNVGANAALNTGITDYDVLVYGDNNDNTGFPAGSTFPGADSGMPLIEDPLTFNKYDGNDIIDVGDDNMRVGVYGQGGNDKIIGGVGATQVDKLFGGSGDDKIWMIEPDRRD